MCQTDKKVSIIITCYNKAPFVEEAILSALNQTYKNIEIVCIDDCSTDETKSILSQIQNKYSQIVILENSENKGVVYSRNKAIEMSTGEYILPLDSDDTIEPTYIEKAVKILDENKKIGIVYCKARFFGIKNEEWNLPEYNPQKIIFGNCIFCSALFRKSDFEKVGGYKEYMNEGWEDYDLWLSFIENKYEVHRIDEILFNYRKTNDTTISTYADKENYMVSNWRKILKNHFGLYAENEEFIKRAFFPFQTIEFEKQHKKYKKYKKLFNLFLMITIFEFLIIIIYIAWRILW